jgi:putative ABC transport system permease protein
MGTSAEYFSLFSYGKKHQLEFSQGRPFSRVFDVVLGADVASKLNYTLGDSIVLAHGTASTSFSMHDDRPFNVVGILKATGTPVDQTVHVSLAGIEAIHLDWQNGVKIPGRGLTTTQLEDKSLQAKNITAFMLGLKSRMATFRVQRDINNYKHEPLTAILPGVALSELWQMMAVLENTLRLVSILVLVAALLGLSAMLLASIRERNREVQLLRVMGASPRYLFFLIELEAILITGLGIILGIATLIVATLIVRGYLASYFGLYLSANVFSGSVGILIALILVAAVLAAAIPSVSLYKKAKTIV